MRVYHTIVLATLASMVAWFIIWGRVWCYTIYTSIEAHVYIGLQRLYGPLNYFETIVTRPLNVTPG